MPGAELVPIAATLDALRAYGATYAELSRRFASSQGVHATDAAALIEIISAEEAGTPLTAAGLGQRIGLTGGATSNLLNRLEASGHVERVRGHADRRIVTITSTSHLREVAEEFFAPLGMQLTAVLGEFPSEQVAAFHEILDKVRELTHDYRLFDEATAGQ